MKNKNNILLVTVLFLSLVMMGCGANKVENTIDSGDFSSRVDPTDNNNDTANHGLLAECNGFSNLAVGLAGQFSTYYDPQTGAYVPDYLRVRLETLPTGVLHGEHYLQVFRWGEAPMGGIATNSEPVSMYILQRGTGAYLNSEALTAISANTIEEIIATHSLGDSGVTVDNFFDRNFVIMTGMDLEFDAVTMAIYDPSQGTDATAWVSALIPAFSADPNVYARNHVPTALQEIHPMYGRRNSGLTESQFLEQTNLYCNGFFN